MPRESNRTRAETMCDLRQGDSQRLAKGEFAKLIGVSRARVSQYIADGLPVEFDGRIDAGRGRDWIKNNLDPTHSVAAANREWADRIERVRAGVLSVPLRLRQTLPHLTVDDTAVVAAELHRAFDIGLPSSGIAFDDVRHQ